MTALARQLPPPPAPTSHREPEKGPLWLCCHLPHLALEAIAPNASRNACPQAVIDETKGQPRIILINEIAGNFGLAPGTDLTTALALCPHLQIHRRDPSLEQIILARLAGLAQRFTPWVGLDYPSSLVLEIRGSLKLFGGLAAITTALRELLKTQGHDCRLAVAPSSFAAWLLASNGLEQTVESRLELRSALGNLAIATLPLEPKILYRLDQAGLKSLRDLWRLPPEGLRKRYGRQLPDLLDRATGLGLDLPQPHRIPPSFSAELELPLETTTLSHYWPVVERLAGQMLDFLASGDHAVARCSLHLNHGGMPPTPVTLELRRPTRDRGHLLALLMEQLGKTSLPGPVRSIALQTEQIQPLIPEVIDLFGARPGTDGSWQRLLETLSSRLDRNAIRSFASIADYRPEQSLRLAERDIPVAAPPPGAIRPLWLLPHPKPASLRSLTLEPGTERIETGWWDDQPIRRDYRTATDAQGRRWWLYRDLASPESWRLQGLFG